MNSMPPSLKTRSGWVRWSRSKVRFSYIILNQQLALDPTIKKTFCLTLAGFLLAIELLTDILARLIDVDDFIAKLWDVHLQVKGEGYVQVDCTEIAKVNNQMLSPV